MTYQETLNWLFAQLPVYQQQGKIAFKKDLTNSIALSKYLGNPEQKFKSIHVGGTNGKGSTSHIIASILQEAGYTVGLYTSPHLKDFTERIRINGIEISKNSVVSFVKEHKDFLTQQQLSFFEMTVGLAFHEFAKQKVDIAVIEVGLGGRLDATNMITPEVSVITNIGLDHTQFLGETLPEIAYEKAGIIKPKIPVVIGERQEETVEVFKRKAAQCHTKITFASDSTEKYLTDVLGDYQVHNTKTAVSAIRALVGFNITNTHITRGLLNVIKNTNLKGRWQILQRSPKIICDTAHNKEGLSYTLNQLKKEKFDTLHVLLGIVSDKKIEELLPLFPKNATYYFCKPNIPRGLSEEVLYKEAKNNGLSGATYTSVKAAFHSLKNNMKTNDVAYIGGSTFVVAAIL